MHRATSVLVGVLAATGAVLYFTTCFQCAFQTTLTFQRLIHFTDWVVGHAHLVMFGVFGFWVIGGIVYLWPKLVGREWWSPALNSWNFWLSTHWSVMAEPGLAIASGTRTTLIPVVEGGGRYHFTERVALTKCPKK